MSAQSREVPASFPANPDAMQGVKLIQTLRGHTGFIGHIAWSPDGSLLASPAEDKTIRCWNARTGDCMRTLEGHSAEAFSVCFGAMGRILASGSADHTVRLWDPQTGNRLRELEWRHGSVNSVAFDSAGTTLAIAGDHSTIALWKAANGKLLRILDGRQSVINRVTFDPAGGIVAGAGIDQTINLWDAASGELLRTLKGHTDSVNSVVFDPGGRILISGSADHTVMLWDVSSGRLVRTLEGPTDRVRDVAVSFDGRLLAAKCQDGTVRIWRKETGEQVAIIPDPAKSGQPTSLAFHPHLPILATVGSDPGTQTDEIIHLWELEPALLLKRAPVIPSCHYVNAKVVLLGDTGVGKSGLSLVLNGQPFEATDSTPGRRVVLLESQEVLTNDQHQQTRETFLWDMAGQPGYRIIHQLHLNEVAVALIVFDARSETDPLAGVRHWERALRLAQQRQASAPLPLKTFLVSARNDRGTVSVSKDRLDVLVKSFGFDGYFETSAREGWQIPELRAAIRQAIPWDALPEVSSSVLFARIKSFLLQIKQTGLLVANANQLYEEFTRSQHGLERTETDLRGQFDTCVGRLENRDVIRSLSFGGYVLLQPELLDAYASAIVNAARSEPDGLGSISEDAVLAGQFHLPAEQKIADRDQEQLLLHATVEELVRHDLALKESSIDGRYLVFPSQFNRDYEDAPEPPGKAVAFTFDGPVQSLYTTLAVRLCHSGLFTTRRTEMWRNAALFTANAGGKCGVYLQEFAEAKGRLILFYESHDGRTASDETRFYFEEFVLAHVSSRALANSVERVRFFICPKCLTPVPDAYVNMLKEQGQSVFRCFCPGQGIVSLSEPKERLQYGSKVDQMEQSADQQRDFEMFVQSARGETSTPSFTSWAGDDRVTLAIVFTDIADSTALGELLKDQRMQEVRRAHFAQSRRLIEQYRGYEIKTIGDSVMAAFRSVEKAFDYARTLQDDPGHGQLQIRAGIHIGAMQIEEEDVFGGAVNFAARVVKSITGAEIWLSDQAKLDLDKSGARQYVGLKWNQHVGIQMKGFEGVFTLWSLER
ncbi:MAG: hypothetical protein JWM11_6971 [Planctomycetaceae bacterium]|nr:hypothetical protein [Planctomycetaceae bacterium]